MPGWTVPAAGRGCKPREFLRLLQGTRAERDAVHGNGGALDDDGHLMAILRFSVFGVAWLGSAAAGLAGGAAAIPGVVPCDQDEDCQHACQGERRCLQPPGRKLQQVCDRRRQARHGRRGDRIRVFDPLPGADRAGSRYRSHRRCPLCPATAARIAVSIGAAVARDRYRCLLMAIRACPSSDQPAPVR